MKALKDQLASFRAEVIVHELLHLKVPRHGKLFKGLLKCYLESRKAPDSGKYSLTGG